MMGGNARSKCIKKPKKQINLGRIIRDNFCKEAAQGAVENENNNEMNKENKNEMNTETNTVLLDHGYGMYLHFCNLLF